MDIVNLIISLVSGIVGGNVAGAAMPDKTLGTVGNSVTGLLGGGIGHYILQALGLFATIAATHATGTPQPEVAQHGLDLGTLLGNVAGSGVGGALLTGLAAWIKNAASK
jgi:uncharacterized membrane protein YeaQ/YmgE (transglycosylase-associated protein family)